MSAISANLFYEALEGNDAKLFQKINECLNLLQRKELQPFMQALKLFDQWTEEPLKYDKSQFQDYRFQHVLIQNFRRYGAWRDGRYYGIRMADIDRQPYTGLFLLGDNGIGKSSLFGALEYWATRKVGEAQYRKIEDEKWYIRHANTNPDIRVMTTTGETFDLDEHSFPLSLDVHRFFISENSMMEAAAFMPKSVEGGANWFSFFCCILGLDQKLIELAFSTDENSFYQQVSKSLEELKDLSQQATDLEREEQLINQHLVDFSFQLTVRELAQLAVIRQKLSEKLLQWEKSFDLSRFFQEANDVDVTECIYVPAIHSYLEAYTDVMHEYSKWSTEKVQRLNSKDDFFTKEIIPEEEFKQKLIRVVEVGVKRLDNLLGRKISLDDIYERKNKLKLFKTLKGKNEDIDKLLHDFELFRNVLQQKAVNFIKSIVDLDLKHLIESNLKEGIFMSSKEKLDIQIDELDSHQIQIDVNGIPVHKYFNTFRYRLFCLSLQVAINLKMMKAYNFNFPLVFDDVFYANDYKNKRQLGNFFEVLYAQASSILGADKELQVLFLTHDEQLISTLHKKKHSYHYGRILDIEECQDLLSQTIKIDDNRKYFNLFFPIFEKYRLI